jgi:very-short-patch-repair endonuclease
MTQHRLRPLAQKLRREATREENHLWYEYLSGYPVRFRRQMVMENYILDFYCHQAKLALELDDSQHYDEQALDRDDTRTQWLNDHSIYVLRFLNTDIWNQLSDVCATIDEVVKEHLRS